MLGLRLRLTVGRWAWLLVDSTHQRVELVSIGQWYVLGALCAQPANEGTWGMSGTVRADFCRKQYTSRGTQTFVPRLALRISSGDPSDPRDRRHVHRHTEAWINSFQVAVRPGEIYAIKAAYLFVRDRT